MFGSKRLLGMAIIAIATGTLAQAGHLQVGQASLLGVDAQKKAGIIETRVAWDNSWRNDRNCDAVWLFAKYRIGQGPWLHVDLKADSGVPFTLPLLPGAKPPPGVPPAPETPVPADFAVGKGDASAQCSIWIPGTRKGLFLFRKQGAGNVSLTGVRLAWDTAKVPEAAKAEVAVFGVEMVYIPEGHHLVGDPKGSIEDVPGKVTPVNCLFAYPGKGAYDIVSEAALEVAAKDGALYCNVGNPRSRDEVPFTLPDAFPKGFKSFWYMKYELSSQQYADFLNHLTRRQQQARVEADICGDEVPNYHVMSDSDEEHLRQSIVCAKKGNGATGYKLEVTPIPGMAPPKDGEGPSNLIKKLVPNPAASGQEPNAPVKFYTYAPARACNYIGWSDLAAFADWSGLRPLTELEYEKGCRGTGPALPNEFAWNHNTQIGRADTFAGADGSGYEKKVPQTGVVNACFGGGIAPFDVGKKAKPDNPGFEGPVSGELFENSRHDGVPVQVNDGASFYGVCHLSGNLWERCVTIGHPEGRKFQGTHGDGNLDEEGYANVADWPGREGGGGGNRGGVWSSPNGNYLRIALRFAANNPRDPRGKNSGLRVGF